MHTQQALTVPTKHPRRTEVFAFRCTAEEREAIFTFAQQLGLPASQVARHYLLQAAALYKQTDSQGLVYETD